MTVSSANSSTETTEPVEKGKNPILVHLVNILVGGMIGLAELVPGVSGGTVALITGIYERAIRNGDALVHGVRSLITDRQEARASFKKVEWLFILTVGIGMFTVVFSMAGVMSSFVDNHTQTARALFLGMVATSLYVPIKLADKNEVKQRWLPSLLLFIAGAVVIFIITGFTSAEKSNPSLIVVFFAAAIAVIALVLPGVSGSFMLLAMGLYVPITAAVDARNMPVITVFTLGAIFGLSVFIKLLKYLMTHHHALTMITMAGFMLGSLRALWPWQDANNNLLMPNDHIVWCLFMFVIGGIVAGVVMLLERFVESEETTV